MLAAPRRLDEPRRELDEYFAGRRHAFELALDWQLTHGFARRVLQATARIPYGSVSSYKLIATDAGSPRAFSAAGNALGTNPLPIIVPCHRVLHSGGGLGGYTGGLERKRVLLTVEGFWLSEPAPARSAGPSAQLRDIGLLGTGPGARLRRPAAPATEENVSQSAAGCRLCELLPRRSGKSRTPSERRRRCAGFSCFLAGLGAREQTRICRSSLGSASRGAIATGGRTPSPRLPAGGQLRQIVFVSRSGTGRPSGVPGRQQQRRTADSTTTPVPSQIRPGATTSARPFQWTFTREDLHDLLAKTNARPTPTHPLAA